MTMLLILGAVVLIALLCSMNATQNDNGRMTFTAGAALEAFRRVKLDGTTANQVVYAGAGEAALGVTQDTAASGDPVSVKLMSAPGTFKVTAAGAIAQNALLYGAANGKVDDAPQGNPIGNLNDGTASSDGDLIEMVARQDEADGIAPATAASVAAAGTTTADATVLASGYKTYQVTGADGTKGVRIAAADKILGNTIVIGNLTAGVLKIYGPPGATINAGAADAAFSTGSGKSALVRCADATNNVWFATGG